MRRRAFMALLGGAAVAWPFATRAQQPGKIPRVGVLSADSPAVSGNLIESFRQGLRDLGYVEGRTIDIEYRWADGRFDQLPNLAAELVGRNVDIILAAGGGQSVLAAKAATATLPIVMTNVGDPVALGFVASLARPGGNITGVSNQTLELRGKHLELLKDAFPHVARVAVLWNPDNPGSVVSRKQFDGPARSLGITLQSVEYRPIDDLEQAFSGMKSERAQALATINSALVVSQRRRIVELAARSGLPTIGSESQWPKAGALMSYGVSYVYQYRRAATYIDRILKGTKPGELPIEQPTKFELVVNLKAAKAIGLTIPDTLLVRADEVIE
jgi:putative ABC transport system substrate-binding protein